MRIAMIGQKGVPALYGGVERHVEDLAVELAKRDQEVLVYARAWYTPKAIKNYQGVRIIHTPTIHTKHLDTITHTLTATIHALFQKPDVIHYHGVGPSLLSFLPRIFSPHTKVITTFHCIDRYHQKWGALARWILKLGEWTACTFAHQTIVVSKTIQNYCLNEYDKLTVHLANGINPPDHVGTANLDRWQLQPKKYVLMTARLIKHKGAHYLIDAWNLLTQKQPTLKDYKLIIVGGGVHSDDYIKELRKRAQNSDSIIFTGWIYGRALNELYANTALLVHPSENEGLPLSVLQAMSYGRPVLLSDIPEHQEIINDPRSLFRNADVYSLAEKLEKLLTNAAWLEELGLANRQLVDKHYQWKNLIERVLDIYHTPINASIVKLKTA